MTPSAFGPMLLSMGGWAFPFILVATLLAGIAAGHATRYRSYLLAAAFVIGYCFADLWRTYLFNYGIIHFLLLTLVAIPFVHPLVLGARERLRPLRPGSSRSG